MGQTLPTEQLDCNLFRILVQKQRTQKRDESHNDTRQQRPFCLRGNNRGERIFGQHGTRAMAKGFGDCGGADATVLGLT
jgi:hypothetical protein